MTQRKAAHEAGRPVVAYALPDAARKALPRWVRHVDDLRELNDFKPGKGEQGEAFVILDEGARKANARRAMSNENLEQVQLTAIIRHKDMLAAYLYQHNRQGDVGLIADADMVLMNRPSELHMRFSRPELRPDLEEARAGFAGMSVEIARQAAADGCRRAGRSASGGR